MSWADTDGFLETGAPVEVLETGFRSTNEILRFASRLLDKSQRAAIRGLRSGPKVEPTKTTRKLLAPLAIEEAAELADAYPEGTVGIIGMPEELDLVEAFLQAAGWRKRAPERWAKGGTEVTLQRPVEARGLEFDGVVVLEPAAFPESLDRRGRLYTSLTRANQELRIVHSQGMPKELK